ncbi:MAG: S46 family peptidase [Lentimicrobium sp.]|nr:S46 family peptidase [Lentimicrobium sp.]
MKKQSLVLVIFLFSFRLAFAVEGMWLPMLLQQLNEDEMKSMGMKISAEDIYSINQSSLKDAILLFGRGCTAEIISDEGLILTNHHCGYGQIQRHSSIEFDYLTDGFWAMSRAEELPNPGLSVTLLIRMEDVTSKVLEGVKPDMTEKLREDKIKNNIRLIEKNAMEGTSYAAKVRPFYYGNEFYLFITETFNDVRLVGAPPSNIGKFGGDTDNWMWPRHTGDFSLFRIYVNKNNEPADYSPENVPYKPKHHLPVSLKGAEKGDFTFVFGYPGTTKEYLPSYGVEMITEHQNPPAIRLREKRLDIFDSFMKQSDLVRIQYSAKHAGVANFWKKMIGENRGIKKLDALNKKRQLEDDFNKWAAEDPRRIEKFGRLLSEFEAIYSKLTSLKTDETYLIEAGLSVETFRFSYAFGQLQAYNKNSKTTDAELNELIGKLKTSGDNFFKNFHQPVDQHVFAEMMKDWFSHREAGSIPAGLLSASKKYGENFDAWAEATYSNSMFTDQSKLNAFLDGYKPSKYRKIEKDPVFILAGSVYDHYIRVIQPEVRLLNARLDSLQRIYMEGLMEFQPDKRFYPDANSTLRVSYGLVDDYSPADAIHYRHYTTLEGIMEKEDPDIDDYVVDPKLRALFQSRNYGRYAAPDGTMRIAFIASNHTTGGNSGSPVLNADGHLIGVNFDRNWEGTMSDLMYDPDQCRNISLDIRYCLFVIDKLAGAGHLVSEMTIIE